jgi:hypothetical protein
LERSWLMHLFAKRAIRRRGIVVLACLLVAAGPLAESAGAAVAYNASGSFWNNGNECAKWSHEFWPSYTAQNNLVIHLAASTSTGQGWLCLTPQPLPQHFIGNRQVEAVWWSGSAWVVYIVYWPNPQTNAANTSSVSMVVNGGAPKGYYYTRATHETLQAGAFHSFTSGADHPVQCFCG